MLPNHAPLRVVETFRVLEKLLLHPGRVDLGIGRAPGTDPVTATVLRRSRGGQGADDFPQQFSELLAFSGDGFPEGHPLRSVIAMPSDVGLPPIWLLGSSGYWLERPGRWASATPSPRTSVRQTRPLPCTSTARALSPRRTSNVPQPSSPYPSSVPRQMSMQRSSASSMQLAWVRMRSGTPRPLPSPKEAMDYSYDPAERRLADVYRSMQVIGDPPTVRARIEELAQHTVADEVMVTTNVYDHDERLRSYGLLAEVFKIATPGR